MTVFTTSEYPPEDMEEFEASKRSAPNFLTGILHHVVRMPLQMRRLGAVQFFSWLAFFSMWSMATPALTEHVFKAPAPDPAAFDMAIATQAGGFQAANSAFQDAADLVGSYMGYYGLSSMLVALLLSFYAARLPLNRKAVHASALVLGGAGFISMLFVPSPAWLILSFALVGVAWASILSMPYALLSSHVPGEKMGIYMGIFNMFIVIPQIFAATLLGPVLRGLFDNQAIYAMVISGCSLLLAALLVARVDESTVDETTPSPTLQVH